MNNVFTGEVCVVTRNVGGVDQLVRMALSIAFIYVGFFDDELIPDLLSSNIIGAIGVFGLVVALTRVCPLYSLTGISTSHHKGK